MPWALLGALAFAGAILFTDDDAARQPRSYAAKAEFKRLNPCPANEKKSGPCPGWQIDHVVPLKCQGDDLPSNMQWLTIDEHKEKTRREARLCLKPVRRQ